MDSFNINNRPYTFTLLLQDIAHFQKGQIQAFYLDYLSLIRFSGDKAADFLQGQITCDVKKLTASTALRGAVCNLKGRILTLFQLIQEEHFYLVLPTDMQQPTIESLARVAMLSRVKVEKDTEFAVMGFYHPDMTPPNIPGLKTLDNNFSIALIRKSDKQAFLDTWKPQGSLLWHSLNLLHKHPEIYPATSGELLPHRLDLHQNGYIHFDKGCYKGQEIIARTHYKATLKHTFVLFKTNLPVHTLQKIFNATTKLELGIIVDYSLLKNGVFLVAASVLKERSEQVYLENSETIWDLVVL